MIQINNLVRIIRKAHFPVKSLSKPFIYQNFFRNNKQSETQSQSEDLFNSLKQSQESSTQSSSSKNNAEELFDSLKNMQQSNNSSSNPKSNESDLFNSVKSSMQSVNQNEQINDDSEMKNSQSNTRQTSSNGQNRQRNYFNSADSYIKSFTTPKKSELELQIEAIQGELLQLKIEKDAFSKEGLERHKDLINSDLSEMKVKLDQLNKEQIHKLYNKIIQVKQSELKVIFKQGIFKNLPIIIISVIGIVLLIHLENERNKQSLEKSKK